MSGWQEGATSDDQRESLRSEADAVVARIYGLDVTEFSYVLDAFPLVEPAFKNRALELVQAYLTVDCVEDLHDLTLLVQRGGNQDGECLQLRAVDASEIGRFVSNLEEVSFSVGALRKVSEELG